MRPPQTFLSALIGLGLIGSPATAEPAEDVRERRVQDAALFALLGLLVHEARRRSHDRSGQDSTRHGAETGWGDDPRIGEGDPRDGFEDPRSSEHDPRRDESDPWWQDPGEQFGEEASPSPALPPACLREVATRRGRITLLDDDCLRARSPFAAALPLDCAVLVRRPEGGFASGFVPECLARQGFEVAGLR